jgi:hypothetical protein
MYALAGWGKCSWNKTYLVDRLVLQKQDGFRDEAKRIRFAKRLYVIS